MAKALMICRNCGMTSEPKRVTPGSIWLEILLWLCAIVPGILYSTWRIVKRSNRCAGCGSADLVPADSPMGQKLARDMQS